MLNSLLTHKMELRFSSLHVFFPLVFIFMVFLMKKRSSNKHLPPGPWKLPIIGNIHNLVGSLPHRSLRDLAKKFGPIMHLQLGEVTTIIVSSPKFAEEIMKTHDTTFASRPFNIAASIICYNASDIAFAPYGEFWRHMRKICMLEVLSAKRVQSFRPVRAEEMLNIVRLISASERSEVNLSKLLLSYTYKVVSRAAIGKMGKEQEAFVPYVKDMIEVVAGFSIANLFPSIKFLHHIGGMRARIERLHQESDRILETIINDHKLNRKASDQEGDHDLVDVLLKLQDQENLDFTLTTESIKGVILDMFIAGSETSSSAAEWAMSEMIKNPRVMEKAQAEVREVFDNKGYVDESDLGELTYLKSVIKETLRLHPPIPLIIPRESRAECDVNGYSIPIKSKVIVNAWAIGRDPNYWSEAESFIPERFSDSKIDYKGTNFEFIPFGAGRRICPGMTFGMVNVELPLANLLYHFDWKLPGEMNPTDLDMTEAIGATVRRKNNLSLIPITCHPLPAEL